MILSRTFIFGILLFPFTLYAQQREFSDDYTYTAGPPYKVADGDKYYFHDDGKVLAVKAFEKSVCVQLFDVSTLSPVIRNDFDDFPKNIYFENVLEIGNRFWLFYSTIEKDNKNTSLFSQEIDFKTASFKGVPIKILTESEAIQEPIDQGYYNSMYKWERFGFYPNYDKSALMVQYRIKPQDLADSTHKDRIGMYILDGEMKATNSGVIEMPYTEYTMDNVDYSFDPSGNALILAMVYDDDTRMIQKEYGGDPNYHHEILKIDLEKEHTDVIRINDDNRFYFVLKFFEMPGNQIYITGGFRKEMEVFDQQIEGYFYCIYTSDGKVHKPKYYSLPKEVDIEVANGPQTGPKTNPSDKSISGFMIPRTVIKNQDKSRIFIAEKYSIHAGYVVNDNGESSYIVHDYSDLLISKIGAEGEVVWKKWLPKNIRWIEGPNWQSYVYYFDEKRKLHIVVTYNTEQNLIVYSIDDENGKTTKSNVLSTKRIDKQEVWQFRPNRVIPTMDSGFLFEVYKKGKEDIMVKVTPKE